MTLLNYLKDGHRELMVLSNYLLDEKTLKPGINQAQR